MCILRGCPYIKQVKFREHLKAWDKENCPSKQQGVRIKQLSVKQGLTVIVAKKPMGKEELCLTLIPVSTNCPCLMLHFLVSY